MNMTTEQRDRIRKVAEHIRSGKYRFDMEYYLESETDDVTCDTVGCIAGHALMAILPGDEWPKIGDEVPEVASVLLGLDQRAADDLFEPRNEYADHSAEEGDPRFVDADRAARQLDYLADTGRVDWSATP